MAVASTELQHEPNKIFNHAIILRGVSNPSGFYFITFIQAVVDRAVLNASNHSTSFVVARFVNDSTTLLLAHRTVSLSDLPPAMSALLTTFLMKY